MRNVLGKKIVLKLLLCLLPAVIWSNTVLAEENPAQFSVQDYEIDCRKSANPQGKNVDWTQMLFGSNAVIEKNLAAQQQMHAIIKEHADPDYYLVDIDYDMSEEQVAELKNLATGIISGCANDYDKIWAITEYVSDTIYYDFDYYNGIVSTVAIVPYEVYTGKKTVCDGYARLVKTLCNLVDIPCMYVLADNHAYNAAYDSQEKRWIFLDATWCSQNSYSEQQWLYGGVYSYYFDMTPRQMANLTNHEIYYVKGLMSDEAGELYYDLYTNVAEWNDTTQWYLIVSKYRQGNEIEVVGDINGINVTKIEGSLFYNCTALETIDLSQTKVTEIEEYAFGGCSKLSTVKLPSTLTTIEYGTFDKCTSLETIDLSQTQITELGWGTFYGCTGLSTVKLPSTLTKIEGGVFENCTSLETMDLSQIPVTEMGDTVFGGCTKLSAVSFPSTLIKIGGWGFKDCTALETVDLSKTQVTEIGNSAYSGCTKLSAVKLPSTLQKIGNRAFEDCTSLETMDLSKTQVAEISDTTYSACAKLSAVILPSTLKRIGELAFYNCVSLKTMDLSHTQVTEIGGNAYSECSELATVTLPSTLLKIGDHAFYGCSSLEEIDLSKSQVTEIGAGAFLMCTKLAAMKMPSTLTKIGDYAFMSCSGIREIDLSQTKVTEIGVNAFVSCEAEIVYLPSTLKAIHDGAFNMYTAGDILVITELTPEQIGYGDESVNSPWGGRSILIAPSKYTVYFHGNGAEETEEIRKYYGHNVSHLLQYNCFTKEDYVFAGWNTQADGKGTSYAELESVKNLTSEVDGEVHLYAQWKKPQIILGTEYATYLGNKYTIDGSGTVRSYTSDGEPIINKFGCDGVYTYFFQADGTAMRDRLTYHPDGVHVIYFDEFGHEVFSNFANVKKTIAGEAVDDYCFFDVYGYLYVDVVTYDQTGTYLYYANPYGVMDRGKWFEFSDSCKWADGTPFDKAGGKYGYANEDGSLLTNTWINDWEGRECYLQGNGVAKY